MKTIILGIAIMAASLVSLAPSGPQSESSSPIEVEIFPAADAATCSPKYSSCNPYVRPNTSCCSKYCKATAPGYGVCL